MTYLEKSGGTREGRWKGGAGPVLSEALWMPTSGDLYLRTAEVVIDDSCRRKLEGWLPFFMVVVGCSITKSHPTLCNPMDCSTLVFPVLHYLLEFVQTHVRWSGDAIWASHPLSPPSPPALNLSQLQGLFQLVSSSHQVAKILEFQLYHQSFQLIFTVEIFRVDFL